MGWAARASRDARVCAMIASALVGCSTFDEELLRRAPPASDRALDAALAPADGGAPGAPDADRSAELPGAGLDAGDANDAGGRRYPPPDTLFIPGRDAGDHDGAAAPPRDATAGDASGGGDAGDGGEGDAGGDGGEGDASGSGDGGDGCETSELEDFCAAIPALPAAPVIDGALDCGVALRPLPLADWNGVAALPDAHRAAFAAAYRPDGLYVYAEIRGQPATPHPAEAAIYCGDAFELYVDADAVIDAAGAYDAPGTMQFIIAAPRSAAAPDPHAERFVGGATQGAWTAGAFEVAWLSDGYAVEAFVVAADLGLTSWMPANSIGLDVAIGVAGPADSADLRCGVLLGQHFLRVADARSGCNGEPWCAADAFCKPALSEP